MPAAPGRVAFNAVAALGFAVCVAPLALLVWLSFVSNEILSLPPDGCSLRWDGAMLGQPQFLQGFRLSLLVALAAAGAGLLVSVPAAFADKFGYTPTVSGVALAPEVEPKVSFPANIRGRFMVQDQEYLAKNDAQLLDWWNKSFKG